MGKLRNITANCHECGKSVEISSDRVRIVIDLAGVLGITADFPCPNETINGDAHLIHVDRIPLEKGIELEEATGTELVYIDSSFNPDRA